MAAIEVLIWVAEKKAEYSVYSIISSKDPNKWEDIERIHWLSQYKYQADWTMTSD